MKHYGMNGGPVLSWKGFIDPYLKVMKESSAGTLDKREGTPMENA